MPQTRILPRSFGLAVLGSQGYKEHTLWQNRAYLSPGTILAFVRHVYLPSRLNFARWFKSSRRKQSLFCLNHFRKPSTIRICELSP
jgi:hypothetical protein